LQITDLRSEPFSVSKDVRMPGTKKQEFSGKHIFEKLEASQTDPNLQRAVDRL
jgi:hypothetical protein